MSPKKYVDFSESPYSKFFVHFANLAKKKKSKKNRRKNRPRASLFLTTCDSKRRIKSERPNLELFSFKALEVALHSALCAAWTHTFDFFELPIITNPLWKIISKNEIQTIRKFSCETFICRQEFFFKILPKMSCSRTPLRQ